MSVNEYLANRLWVELSESVTQKSFLETKHQKIVPQNWALTTASLYTSPALVV